MKINLFYYRIHFIHILAKFAFEILYWSEPAAFENLYFTTDCCLHSPYNWTKLVYNADVW